MCSTPGARCRGFNHLACFCWLHAHSRPSFWNCCQQVAVPGQIIHLQYVFLAALQPAAVQGLRDWEIKGSLCSWEHDRGYRSGCRWCVYACVRARARVCVCVCVCVCVRACVRVRAFLYGCCFVVALVLFTFLFSSVCVVDLFWFCLLLILLFSMCCSLTVSLGFPPPPLLPPLPPYPPRLSVLSLIVASFSSFCHVLFCLPVPSR